jgi:hypothetical protein
MFTDPSDCDGPVLVMTRSTAALVSPANVSGAAPAVVPVTVTVNVLLSVTAAPAGPARATSNPPIANSAPASRPRVMLA